jgi:hypothetical protein
MADKSVGITVFPVWQVCRPYVALDSRRMMIHGTLIAVYVLRKLRESNRTGCQASDS